MGGQNHRYPPLLCYFSACVRFFYVLVKDDFIEIVLHCSLLVSYTLE